MLAPWQLTFDLRERETAWSDENKARLVAIVSARDLGCTHEQLDAALSSLILLLPDLGEGAPRPAGCPQYSHEPACQRGTALPPVDPSCSPLSKLHVCCMHAAS